MESPICRAVISTCLILLSAAQLRADAVSAGKYIDDATGLVGKGPAYFDEASGKLDLADANLEDAADADKATLKTKIEAVRKQIQAAAGSADKQKIETQLKNALSELEGVVGNLVAWPSKSQEITALLDDPKTAAALGADALANYRKQYATMAKVHNTKALKENLAAAKEQVDQLEKYWNEAKPQITAADISPEGRQQKLNSASREFEEIDRPFKDLPADNADVKALQARVTKLKADYEAVVGNAAAAAAVEEINRYFESEKSTFDGMDAEKGDATWADFKASKGDARSFNALKTMDFYNHVNHWLPEFKEREVYKQARDSAPVKARLAEIDKKLAEARTKIRKAAEALVVEFEKEKVTQANTGDGYTLGSQIKFALGDNDPDAKTLVARVDSQFTQARDASNKADADNMAYYKSMTDQANKAWPGMASKFTVADGFDPNNASALSGKYVQIVGHNLMGWSFKHGDFPYATKVNGVAVAGRYDPAVKAALKEVEDKLGRAIGDSDSDGEWTAIARVEGSSGKLVQLIKSTGDVKVDGANVGTVEATDERSVDAPIVTIVALKAGPVAVAQGVGAVKQDGSIAAPAGMHRGFSLFGIVTGLLAILVGAACLMKAQFAPLATNSTAANLSTKMGSQNIAYLGVAGVVLGAIGVLMNLIALPTAFLSAVIGLIASAAMIVAGGVAGGDLIRQHVALPPKVDATLRQFAIPAGLTCAALGVLTLLMSIF